MKVNKNIQILTKLWLETDLKFKVSTSPILSLDPPLLLFDRSKVLLPVSGSKVYKFEFKKQSPQLNITRKLGFKVSVINSSEGVKLTDMAVRVRSTNNKTDFNDIVELKTLLAMNESRGYFHSKNKSISVNFKYSNKDTTTQQDMTLFEIDSEEYTIEIFVAVEVETSDLGCLELAINSNDQFRRVVHMDNLGVYIKPNQSENFYITRQVEYSSNNLVIEGCINGNIFV